MLMKNCFFDAFLPQLYYQEMLHLKISISGIGRSRHTLVHLFVLLYNKTNFLNSTSSHIDSYTNKLGSVTNFTVSRNCVLL